MTRTITVACCQISPVVGDKQGNLDRVRVAVSGAADKGADVVVVPELASTGYVFADMAELRALAEPADGPTVRGWTRLAAELDLVLVAGFAEAAPDGAVYNSAVLIDPSGVRSCYRKAHLWDREKELFTPGSELPPVVSTSAGRIGVVICYDLGFPEWVRSVALDGAELLCAPVNWPLSPRPEGERPSEVVKVQADAIVNRIFVAVADRTGTERGQEWLGGSVIVDADGFPLTGTILGEEGTVFADVNLADARNKRLSERNDAHADRRQDLYPRGNGTN
jgi:predicted amidohydrolase